MAVGLERVHNLDVMAQMLLNGEIDFCRACDFKELGMAKISHAIPCKLCASQRRTGPGDFIGGLLKICFELRVLLTITDLQLHRSHVERSLVALLSVRGNRADRDVFDYVPGATGSMLRRS